MVNISNRILVLNNSTTLSINITDVKINFGDCQMNTAKGFSAAHYLERKL